LIVNKDKKKTLVIGASPKPHRYAYTAVMQLQRFDYPVVALGIRPAKIGDVEIQTGFPLIDDVHTITMYVGPGRQPQYFDYIFNTIKPKRIILNPGTENTELSRLAEKHRVEVVEGCTLMMLSYDSY
jgi:hypothetical protein